MRNTKKAKKIYKYVNKLVKKCMWCTGRGWENLFGGQTCSTCKGTGGEWKRIKILVGEEVTE